MLMGTPSEDSIRARRANPCKQAAAAHGLSRVALAMAILANGYNPAQAQSIVTNGDVKPNVPSPPPSIWNVGGSLFVGETGNGTLTIADGAIVNDSNGFVGQQLGSSGAATVSGAGSRWVNAGNLYVGSFGVGTLGVIEGARVSSRNGAIADNEGSVGAVTVSGVGSVWSNTRDLLVGVSGSGTLLIADGGRVSAELGALGLDTLGSGSMTVTGTGSAWVDDEGLSVGAFSTGTLSILDGGTVSSGIAYIGSFFESTGSALVSGAGSIWTTNDTLAVGNGGSGTLTVAEGAAVSVQNGAGLVGLAVFAGSAGTISFGAPGMNPGDATGAGKLDVARVEFGDGVGILNFNHTDAHFDFAPMLISAGSGAHRINHLAGTTVLTGNSSAFTGTTMVSGGTLIVVDRLGGSASITGGRLQVDGSFGGPVAIEQSGTLAGVGTISGAATFANGGILAGTQGQALKVGGDLTLASTSQVNVLLGGSPTPALFDVAGTLTLDGTLNIASQGGFGLGVYRLFDYQGGLTDNGMVIGTTPSGVSSSNLQIQTALGGQVNLVSTVGATLSFWDGGNAVLHNNGTVDGGSGVWRADGSNWTVVDGAINGPFQPNPNFAIFQGAPGTVTVDNIGGAIGVTGLQIAVNGYRIEGDEIALQGGVESIIRVGDSSAASASMRGTIDASLTGASRLVKTDFGTLVLSGSNSYSGGTDIRGGVLSVSSDVNLGAAAGALTLDGGTLATTASFATGRAITLAQLGEIDVADNSELTLSGSIDGSGDLYKSGTGTLILTGTNNYADTRVESGTLIGNTGSISGSLLNSATVIFDETGDATYAGEITGRGNVVKRGAGALTLSGTSRHNWRIENGTLISSADRYIGNAQIGSAGTLRFEQASDATYAGMLSGSGGFSKTGTGQLKMTGNSSAFTGHTQVERGTLSMSAQSQLGGTLTIASGATLEGAGRVGTTLLQSGATIAPGNNMATLRVAGNLTFAPGSIYRVEADPNSAASSRIAVTGTANLAGSVVHIGPEGGFESTRQYTILTANAVEGQFATVSSNYAFLNPTLSYGAQEVILSLVRKADFADAALTYNQRATANGLDSLPADNALHEYIVTLPFGTPPTVFDSLSGELHASVASGLRGSATMLSALPLSHLHSRLQSGTVGTRPVWAQFVGDWRTLPDDGNAAQVRQHSKGLFIGADHMAVDGWQLGGALGYTGGDLRVDDRASKADLSSYSAILFGGKSFEVDAGKLNLLVGVAYTWHDIDTRRYTSVAGASQTLKAGYSARTAQIFTELSYSMHLSERIGIEPFAGLAWNDLRIGSFAESGGSAALSGRTSRDQQTSATLGSRALSVVSLGEIDGQLRATLGWQHAFGDVVAQKTMAFDGGQAFTVAGAPIARNAALVEIHAQVALTRTITLGLNYIGQYGDGNRGHTGMLTFHWSN